MYDEVNLRIPDALPLGKEPPGIHWTEGRRLGGPQSQSGCSSKEKIPLPDENQTPVAQSVA